MTTTTAQPQVQGVDYEVTGLGRIVQGDLETLDNKDMSGAVKIAKSGPDAGKPAKPENFFAEEPVRKQVWETV